MSFIESKLFIKCTHCELSNQQIPYSQKLIDFIRTKIKKDPEHVVQNLKNDRTASSYPSRRCGRFYMTTLYLTWLNPY
ncbi:hypothetical protein [uncultured Veillonella sp.]|uniref:hypothetical protein n=1 Tax=uncultured Veillonella sp. TaxID=159268 RepID=UPI00338D7780